LSRGSLYIFLDEGGDFNFSPKGSRHFTFTALSVWRPFTWEGELSELRYACLEKGIEAQYFHATEDSQAIRNLVFDIIARHLNAETCRVDCLVVDNVRAGIAAALT